MHRQVISCKQYVRIGKGCVAVSVKNLLLKTCVTLSSESIISCALLYSAVKLDECFQKEYNTFKDLEELFEVNQFGKE